MSTDSVARYGVNEQAAASSPADRAAEKIRMLGYAVVDSGLAAEEAVALASAFDRELAATHAKYGHDALTAIDEHNTVRAPLASDRSFLALATGAVLLGICRSLMGRYIVLNQQNGIVNPPNAAHYNQGAYHRDLPYQHFVSSRPLAVNAIFCIDPFTKENGATWVIPASHKMERFPADEVILDTELCIEAPAGSFIVLDSMLFHRGGVNTTALGRRAVNQVYSIPFLRQQIDLPALLGPGYSSDAELRQLLGYGVETPRGIADYYDGRRTKLPRR